MPSYPDNRWLTTREAAELLRLRPRTVYHLVSRNEVPHARAGGKLLFDREALAAWVASRGDGPSEPTGPEPPPTVAGSHDPLFEWAVRESRSGLALATYGSVDGLDRLSSRAACAALVHIPDAGAPSFNHEALRQRHAGTAVVALRWARREQGLIVAPGNPLRIGSVHDLLRKGVRVVARQPGAGSGLLLAKLMRTAGADIRRLRAIDPPASSEADLAEAISEGYADAGFGIRAVARRYRLDFVPLAWEEVDLAAWRRSFFEPPLQALLRFSASRRFALHAGQLGGYDLSGHGAVKFNG